MIKNKVSGIARIMGAILILSGWYVVADDNLAANETLQTLFERDVPEHSRQLRALWEEERMLAQILSMDTVRDWAGLPPGEITVSPERQQGMGSLRVPVRIDPWKHLRVENNFLSGHHDGFRNMMGMGMEVENFAPYRSIRFSVKTRLKGAYAFVFRLFDRSGGWMDWNIPNPEANEDWFNVVLSVPPDSGKWLDIRRIGGVMFELRARDESVTGEVFLDGLELVEEIEAGVSANAPIRPDMAYALNPPRLEIPQAHAQKEVEFIFNMSPLELPIWDNDHEATMRCLNEELERFSSLKHGAVFINPGTRKPVNEDPDYLPNLQELLVKVARHCERQGVPFYQMTGVEGLGFYPAELMFAVERAAPTMCRGFLFAECSVETNNHVDYLIELLNYLAPRNKKALYFQQTSYWLGIMQHQSGDPGRFLRTIQDSKYKDVFVPMWENLLPASQGLCFGSTLGFWRGGLTSDWGVSAQSWGYANLNFGGTADMPGHWWLRMFLHAITTGGRFVEIEPIWPFDGENTEGQVRHSKQWGHTQRWIGDTRSQLLCDLEPGDKLRALRYMDRLIEAGIVRSPARPVFLKSLPDISLKVIDQDVESPTRYRWGIFRRALEENWWNLGDCPNAWEMALQTPQTDVFRSLYHSSHIYDQTVPQTPYGIVSIAPPGSRLPSSTQIIECDGYSVYRNGRWLDVQEAHETIVQAFEKAANHLPFRAEGCFLSVVEAAPDSYLAYLIDPEERFPIGVDTELEIHLEGDFSCIDALTRRVLPIDDETIAVQIPPAGFRTLYLSKR